jgi:hypothetical protein
MVSYSISVIYDPNVARTPIPVQPLRPTHATTSLQALSVSYHSDPFTRGTHSFATLVKVSAASPQKNDKHLALGEIEGEELTSILRRY